jgi:cytochrome c-type biogenesis protein CcmH/NrfG
MAQVQAAQKKYKRAIENYEKFLELAPKNDPDRDDATRAIRQLKKK